MPLKGRPRRRVILAAAAVVAGVAAVAVLWHPGRRSVKVPLEPIAAPSPPCVYTLLAAPGAEGRIEFGDVTCGTDSFGAGRFNGAWYRLPLQRPGARYPMMKSSADQRQWVVFSGNQLYLSDDGGVTFFQLRPPDWDELKEVPWVAEPEGAKLERLVTLRTWKGPDRLRQRVHQVIDVLSELPHPLAGFGPRLRDAALTQHTIDIPIQLSSDHGTTFSSTTAFTLLSQ